MNKRAIGILAGVSAAWLAGCAAVGSGGLHWRTYLENDGSLSQIAFTERVRDTRNDGHNTLAGEAFRRTTTGSADVLRRLGSVYLEAHRPDGSSIYTLVMNADKNTDVDLHNPADMRAARAARQIKVYTMGGGMLETVLYRSVDGLCATYRRGGKISVRSVTNYYGDDSSFFASIVHSELSQKGYRIVKQEMQSNLRNNLPAPTEAQLAVLNAHDVAKQARILAGSLCGEKIPDAFMPPR